MFILLLIISVLILHNIPTNGFQFKSDLLSPEIMAKKYDLRIKSKILQGNFLAENLNDPAIEADYQVKQ